MRAAVVAENGAVELAEVDDNSSPLPGWVTVRVAFCGICGSDLHFLGSPLAPPGLIMGHEFTGLIEAVGECVVGVSEGDRVVVLPAQRCSETDEPCPACSEGASQHCARQQATSIGIAIPGGFAERVDVPASSCVRLGEEASLEMAALSEPLAVAIHAVNASRFAEGMRVGVVGAGPIGLLTVAVLKLRGGEAIGVAEPVSTRAEIALKMGATVVVNRASQLASSLGGAPAVIFECAGRPETPGECIGVVRPGGEVILAGVADPSEMLHISSILWVIKEINVRGVIAYTNEEFADAVKIIETGALNPEPIVSAVLPLEKAPEAFAELKAPNQQVKVLIAPNGTA